MSYQSNDEQGLSEIGKCPKGLSLIIIGEETVVFRNPSLTRQVKMIIKICLDFY